MSRGINRLCTLWILRVCTSCCVIKTQFSGRKTGRFRGAVDVSQLHIHNAHATHTSTGSCTPHPALCQRLSVRLRNADDKTAEKTIRDPVSIWLTDAASRHNLDQGVRDLARWLGSASWLQSFCLHHTQLRRIRHTKHDEKPTY